MRRWGIAFVLLAASCDAQTSTNPVGGGGDAGDAGVVAPAHCGFDPAFPPRDAGIPGQCLAARYSLTCGSSQGGTAICISDDATRCDTSTTPTQGCTNHCAPNEYGAVCGGVPAPIDGGGTVMDQKAPSACRGQGVVPSGAVFLCCPCQ